jgi:hypothetical protein
MRYFLSRCRWRRRTAMIPLLMLLMLLMVVRGRRRTATVPMGTAIPDGTTRGGRRLLRFQFFFFLFHQLARNTHTRRLGIQ